VFNLFLSDQKFKFLLLFAAARSHSQATLDSLDISRFSEDGADEKVAVLEFELRKAKENISGLRATLTQMTAGAF
jgi:hypothetical protein